MLKLPGRFPGMNTINYYQNIITMLKKLIFSVAILTIGLGGVMLPQFLSASSVQHSLDKEITDAEKTLVCCELADQKILDLGTAIRLMRDGVLTITKIESGVYQVVYPGGLLIISVDDDNI